MNLGPFVTVWGVLAAAILVLVGYRASVARSEDASLHVSQVALESEQASIAHKLDQIDRWGKILTVVLVVYGLGIAGMFLYLSFKSPSSLLG